MRSIFFCFLACFYLFLFACSKDTNAEETEDCMDFSPSYVQDIEPIMSTACALSGCHVSGFINGDFSSYAGVKNAADDGSLERRAIVQQNMPPSNTSGPQNLTEAELGLLNCWIENGALDN